MLINLVAHTCVPQGFGSGGNCFVSVVSFISVALCRQTNVDSFVFAALLAALHWSAISFIINFHFSNFTANAQTHTSTQLHTMGGRKTTANSGWTVQKPYSAVRGFSVLLPPCREQINCVVSCRRLCCLWMMTMGCRSCRSHARAADHTIAHLFPAIISIQ